ncbi:MAG: lipid A deacylase LpxR family protein [Psychromonas sp.]|nr:lipid A deacylase LpxR family protein [Psychromonas sp.]
MNIKSLIVVVIIFLSSFSAAEDDVDFFRFTFENDFFAHDDGLYSNGLIAAWGYDDVAALDKQILPDWLAYLAQNSYLTGQPNKNYAITYTLAHLMQTAISIRVADLIEEDAPYVGMLGWKAQLAAYDQSTIDRLSLMFGMVGPIAGAEYVQSTAHVATGSTEAKGWDNQIDNEAVFQLQAERSWRVYENSLYDTEFDLITAVNGGIGNFRSDLGTAVGLRWGVELQNSFATASAFPSQKFNRAHYSPNGWYFFANASASYVANDIFMDGNTFSDSHSVDLIHLQCGTSFGVMANIYNWNVVYTLLHLSDQYEGQNERSRFGSISITYHF